MRHLIKYYKALIVVMGLGLFMSCNEEFNPEIAEYPEISIEDFSPKTAPPTSLVTITGTNFGDRTEAVTVTFSGVEAEVISTTDNEIVVAVPEGAASGKISVKVWLSEKEFTDDFTVLPGAKITKLSATKGDAGDEITITGAHFGTNVDEIAVYFTGGEGQVEAEIVSASDTEIVVTVPAGITGPVTVAVGTQTVTGPVFEFSATRIEYLFETPGDMEGWTTSHSSTTAMDFGVLKVNYDMSADKRRADFSSTEDVIINTGSFPIVAIRIIDKPSSGNFIFDTNLGTYKNGSNNWEGIVRDNIYYYDMRNTFGADNNELSQTEATTFTTFQWKIADVTTDEKAYFVDWVRSFASVSELEAYAEAQHAGQRHYGFTIPRTVTPEVHDDWIGRLNQPGTTTVIEDGYAKVTFETQSDGANKTRADFNYSHGGEYGAQGSGIPQEPWLYRSEYPIYAIKLHFVNADESLGGPRPATGTVRYDRLGNFDNTYADTHNVLWVDASTWAGGEDERTEGSWWAVVIADILSPEKGYWVDWHRTYRSVEEMEFYIN